MKVKSKEYLTVEDFRPVKYIKLYRAGRHILTIKSGDSCATLRTLKEEARHEWRIIRAREAEGGGRRRRLAIIDDNKSLYHLRFWVYYKNIAEEYRQLNQLKMQLEKDFPIIECTTATSKKEYCNHFKIIYKGAKNI